MIKTTSSDNNIQLSSNTDEKFQLNNNGEDLSRTNDYFIKNNEKVRPFKIQRNFISEEQAHGDDIHIKNQQESLNLSRKLYTKTGI